MTYAIVYKAVNVRRPLQVSCYFWSLLPHNVQTIEDTSTEKGQSLRPTEQLSKQTATAAPDEGETAADDDRRQLFAATSKGAR